MFLSNKELETINFIIKLYNSKYIRNYRQNKTNLLTLFTSYYSNLIVTKSL